MIKNLKIIWILTFALVMLIYKGTVSFADETSSELKPYEAVLEELNSRFGTNYLLYPTENQSNEEMTKFYTNMTLEEFELYIITAHEAEVEFDKKATQPLMTEIFDREPLTRATFGLQAYYYDGSNGLYMEANTTTVNANTVYTNFGKTGTLPPKSYPYYNSSAGHIEIASDLKTVQCSWTCAKYLSENLIATGLYTLSCTFKAGGGNVYMTVR